MDQPPAWFTSFANEFRAATLKTQNSLRDLTNQVLANQNSLTELANRVSALESATNSKSAEEEAKINKIDAHLTALSHMQILSDTCEASISGIPTNSGLENKEIIHKIFSALKLDTLLQFIFELRDWVPPKIKTKNTAVASNLHISTNNSGDANVDDNVNRRANNTRTIDVKFFSSDSRDILTSRSSKLAKFDC